MDRNKLSEKYGIDPAKMDQMLKELSIIRIAYNGGLTPNKITRKNAQALSQVAQAEPVRIDPVQIWRIDPITGTRRIEPYKREPFIEKIKFTMTDGSTIVLTDPQAIESIRWHVKGLSEARPQENPANRPTKPERKTLRRIIIEFVALRDKPNQHQQFLDVGMFLSDVGFLMNYEQWDNNPGGYVSFNEYLLSNVKNAIR